MGRYGLVRLRIVFDDERANKGEGFVMYQVYDPSANQWVEVGKDVAEDIAGRVGAWWVYAEWLSLSTCNTEAWAGPYGEYVVEWVDGLPKCLVVVNVGVRIIYRGRRGNTEYFEAKPL